MSDTIKYDPRSTTHRRALADELLALFDRAVFTEVFIEGTKERVFAREVPGTDGKMRVLVYSTIEGDKARSVAKDAIRVCAVYAGRAGERGIASGEKRVNRVGTTEAIAERVIERMRDCWRATKTASKCSCGAPHFKSKVRKSRDGKATGGNLVCADFHWKSDDELASDNARYQSSRSRRSSYGGYRRSSYASAPAYRSAVPAGATLPASWENAPLAKQVAFMMAAGDDSGYDWDRWADDVKEGY